MAAHNYQEKTSLRTKWKLMITHSPCRSPVASDIKCEYKIDLFSGYQSLSFYSFWVKEYAWVINQLSLRCPKVILRGRLVFLWQWLLNLHTGICKKHHLPIRNVHVCQALAFILATLGHSHQTPTVACVYLNNTSPMTCMYH